MRLSELQHKDVINMSDGTKIGNIIDIIVDKDGKMSELIIEKSKFIISFFSSKGEITIKWEQIKKIGEDVILINLDN